MALTDKEMMTPMATIHWCPADIKHMYPGWTDEKCMEVMGSIARHLEDHSIELGWEALETLVSDYEFENEDEDEV